MNLSGNETMAIRMRQEFDHAFSLPTATVPPEAMDLLAVHLRGDRFAVRVLEISGLLAGKKIIPLPGSPPALLGLAGIRGSLVPAWDLAVLLGYPGQSRGSRWVMLGRGNSPWALAFDGFDGYFRVLQSEVHAGTGKESATGVVRESCPIDGTVLPIVSLPLILLAITKISESSQPRRK